MIPGQLSDELRELGTRAAKQIAQPEAFQRMNGNERIIFGLGQALADLWNCRNIDPRLIAADALDDNNNHLEAKDLRDAAC